MSDRVLLIATLAVAAVVAVAQAQTFRYVDQSATLEPHDGSDWCHAYFGVSDALSAAAPGTVIRVADGTYLPDPTGLANPREATFHLFTGVTLEGGYAGCGAADPDERDIGQYETILSGDLNGDDVPWANRADNVYHVVTASGVDATALLDGFTVRGGYARAAWPNDRGGGLYFYQAGPTVTRCTFRDNAAQSGAGWGGSAPGLPVVRHCAFSGNWANQDGGGVMNASTALTFVNCLFSGNYAPHWGGGIFHAEGFQLTLVDCTFVRNSGSEGGGGVMAFYSPLTVTNSVFCRNMSMDGPQISDPGGQAIVTWSCVLGGWPGTGNIDLDPLLIDEVGPDEVPGTPDDNLRLSAASPCIDAADNAAAAGIATDLDGYPRFMDDPDTPDTGSGAPPIVDMGAYEYSPDCNGNGVPDGGDIAAGTAADCNGNGILDECDVAAGTSPDCNSNGIPDECDIASAASRDCNYNAVPDECDLAAGTSSDCNMNGIPDECEAGGLEDCNANDVPDLCDIYVGTSTDINGNGIPDDCEPVRNLTQGTLYFTIQEGINAASAGDVIEVLPGTYQERINLLGKAITLRSSGGPDVTTIDGDAAGTVITCTGGEGPGTVIRGFTVTNGFAANGGGMYNENSSPALTNCTFSGNTGSVGGAIHDTFSSLTLTNCTFSGNTTTASGGAIHSFRSSMTLTNCTFSGNFGGGMSNYYSSPTLTNCILWADTGPEISVYESNPSLTYCDVQGGWRGTGNIDLDPQFASATDVHLLLDSPCIDAGTNDPPGGLPGQDIEGQPRLMDGDYDGQPVADMGAYEWDPSSGPRMYVPDMYPTIQAAIDAALPRYVVMIAEGVYAGPGNRDLDFAGKRILVCSATGDPATCVIDCEGQGRGFYFHSGEAATSVIQGLTIRGGYADDYGAGVYCSGASPRLIDCAITGSAAEYYGGALFCDGSNPTLINCTLGGNVAGYGGGGVFCEVSDPVLTNCVIIANAVTSGAGGGLDCYHSSPTLTNCTLAGNTADYAGGIDLWHSDPILTNCVLWADAPSEIYAYASNPTLTYCDVQGGWPGTGNIDADPLFADPDGPDGNPAIWEDNDYRLTAASPCIDVGDPAFVPAPGEVDLGGNPRVADGDGDGTASVDMGAYEFKFGVPGDMNCDGLLNAFDIDPFVLALTGAPAFMAYHAAFPDCDAMLADINDDGAVNAFDIDPFVLLLTGG